MKFLPEYLMRTFFLIPTFRTSLLTSILFDGHLFIAPYIIWYEIYYNSYFMCCLFLLTQQRNLELLLWQEILEKRFNNLRKLLQHQRSLEKLHSKVIKLVTPFLCCVLARSFITCIELYQGVICSIFWKTASLHDRLSVFLSSLPFIILHMLDVLLLATVNDHFQRIKDSIVDGLALAAGRLVLVKKSFGRRQLLMLEKELDIYILSSEIKVRQCNDYSTFIFARLEFLTFVHGLVIFTVPFLQYFILWDGFVVTETYCNSRLPH